MLVKTRGIVLNYIKYRETSIIARIYTEQLGLQTYVVNSVRKKGPTMRMALFQPLSLLEMVVYPSAHGGITRISEYKSAHPFQSLHYDIRKSSMAFLLAEIVSLTVKEEESSPALFNFLYQSIVALDEKESGFEDFHLVFLLQLLPVTHVVKGQAGDTCNRGHDLQVISVELRGWAGAVQVDGAQDPFSHQQRNAKQGADFQLRQGLDLAQSLVAQDVAYQQADAVSQNPLHHGAWPRPSGPRRRSK